VVNDVVAAADDGRVYCFSMPGGPRVPGRIYTYAQLTDAVAAQLQRAHYVPVATQTYPGIIPVAVHTYQVKH